MNMIIVIILLSGLFLNTNAQNNVKKEYYPNGKLKSEIGFSDSLRDGEAKFYYENGNLKEERNYVNGRVEGIVKLYRENGKLSELFTITDGKREGPASLFDSTGNYVKDINFAGGIQSVAEGKQEAVEKKDSSFIARIEQLKHSSAEPAIPPQLSGEQRKDDPAFFISLDVPPKPIGGMAVIYKKLVYPQEAREDNIEGTVEVLALIDEEGNVVDTKVIKGLGHGCDESAQTAIRYTKFAPGFIKGNPVKSQLKISIEFKSYNH